MRTLTVHVTREHINNGTKMSCFTCPVALAILHAIGLQIGDFPCPVQADRDGLKIGLDRYPTPKPVVDFMNRFD